MEKVKQTEADLARKVVESLSEMGWEIYQEVEGPGGGVATSLRFAVRFSGPSNVNCLLDSLCSNRLITG